MADIYPKVLLVEGKQERLVIPELMEANGIDWGTRKSPVVYIRDYDGYQNLVDPDVISTELQASGLYHPNAQRFVTWFKTLYNLT